MADANTKRSNHIFPLYLKAKAVALDESATGNLDVDTSYITFNADLTGDAGKVSLTLPDGKIPGQIMVLDVLASGADGDDYFEITITSALDDAHDVITLDAAAERATLLWNGEAWIILSLDGATVA